VIEPISSLEVMRAHFFSGHGANSQLGPERLTLDPSGQILASIGHIFGPPPPPDALGGGVAPLDDDDVCAGGSFLSHATMMKRREKVERTRGSESIIP
jgi:hypothetical protein